MVLIGKSLVVFVLLVIAEILHGITRTFTLARWVGDFRARQLSVISGCLIILAISWVFIPWIGPVTHNECLEVGALWFCCMLGFEVGFGRRVMRLPWKRILEDFDLRRGGMLGFGMIFLALAPLLAANLRGLL